jgi:hypothetical protein
MHSATVTTVLAGDFNVRIARAKVWACRPSLILRLWPSVHTVWHPARGLHKAVLWASRLATWHAQEVTADKLGILT